MTKEYANLLPEVTNDSLPLQDGYRLLLPTSIFVLILVVLLMGTAQGQGVGNRGPEWQRHVIDIELSGADGGRLLDVDDDGDLDLSVGWEESGVTRIYLNPGYAGVVTDPWPYIDVGNASGVEDAVMGDLDGDGRVDVVSARDGGKRVTVHFAPTSGDYTDPLGWTTMSFPAPASGAPAWMYSVLMDVDEDGDLDIVAGGKGNNAVIRWFEAPTGDRRNLSSWPMHDLGGVGWLMSLFSHDMDGDGDLDLMLSDRKIGDADLRGARWLENPGTSEDQTLAWTNHYIYHPDDGATEVMFLDLVDLDGDGLVDVVVPLSNGNRLRWFHRLDSSGLNWVEYLIDFPSGVGQRAKSIRAGDLDNDGNLDLVLSTGEGGTSTSGVIWLEPTSGVFAPIWTEHEISGLDGIKFDDSQLIDLDGDGDLDVINTEEDFGSGSKGLGVIWYENPLEGIIKEDFTLIVLPDTQMYSDNYPEIFQAQTQWIVDNKNALNIVYVAHEGDIVDHADDESEWINADNAMSLLDAAMIPYGVVPGNHDEPTTFYNQYFGVDRFCNSYPTDCRSYYGDGYPSGSNDNNYTLFTAGGMDFIVINLEYVSPAAGALDWADQLLKDHSDRRAIVVSHYILNANATFSSWGQQIYDALSDNPNPFLMLCGHIHAEARRTDGKLHTLLADYQDYPNGGNGFLRIMHFLPETNEIRVKTYSPWLDQYETDPNSQFALSYDMGGLGSSDAIINFQDGLSPEPGYFGTLDTVLSQNDPSINYSGDIALYVDGDDPPGSGTDLSTLLYWDISAIPAGSIIHEVSLTLNVVNASNDSYQVHEMKRDWVESESTWNLYSSTNGWEIPGALGSQDRGDMVLGSFSPTGTGPYVINLNSEGMALVQAWVDNPTSNHGFIIANGTATDGADFDSREALTANNRPKLTVLYYDPLADIVINANYDSGSIGSYIIDGDVIELTLNTETLVNTLDDYTYWTNFKVSDVQYKTITFRITNAADVPFLSATPVGQDSYMVYSCDGENWNRLTNYSYTGDVYEFTQYFDCHEVQIATFFPFSYERMQDYVDTVSASQWATETFLGTSEQGKNIDLLTITNTAIPDTDKEDIYIIGRQHASEISSSHMIKGMIDFLISNDPDAEAMRDNFIFYIVPMVNPDGVASGKSRATSENRDPNRDWDNSQSVEINIVRNNINSIDTIRKIDLFIDWHSQMNDDRWYNFVYTTPVHYDFYDILSDWTDFDDIVTALSDCDSDYCIARSYTYNRLGIFSFAPEPTPHLDTWTIESLNQEGVNVAYAIADYFGAFPINTPPSIDMQPSTPADGAIIGDTSVEIEVAITEPALRDVIFRWDGTDHWLYDDSLVLMLNFDNVAALGESYAAAGDVVKDLSGSGNDGYLSDAVYDTAKVPAWISNGRYGGAFDFTGNGTDSGQSIRVPHSESMNPYGGDFALAVWILTRDDYDGDIIRKGSTSTATTWYKIEHAPEGDTDTIALNFNTDDIDATVTSTKVYNDNQWHFVVAQRRGDQAELWIDGALAGTAPVSGSISNDADLAIGSKDTQDDDFLNSAVDEVRIYNRFFSQNEIQELYYSNLSKNDIDKWTLYVNQSNLADGIYTYQAFAVDMTGAMGETEQRSLTVAVPDDTSWKFIVYGDTRSNDSAHRSVLQSIMNNTSDYEFVINVGDVVEDGSTTSQWDTWQNACNDILGGTGQSLVPPEYMACPGNHDEVPGSGQTNWNTYLSGQVQQFGNSGSYFVFDYENARFVILNSEESLESMTGTQKTMLLDAVQNNPKEWLFTVWHKPIFDFGSKSYEDSIHDNWGVPLYQNGADIMFMGHAHYYVRTKKLGLNGAQNPPLDSENGTVQIVSGNGGAPLSLVNPDEDGNGYMLELESYTSDNYGYTELTVNGSTLTMRHILADGSVFDQATYSPNLKSTPDVTPPSPDPMEWDILPNATSSTSISMTARTATDPRGVEYYFDCTAGGGNDSDWQDSPTYEDTGLQPDTSYTYTVTARDKSANRNDTVSSSEASATTENSGSNLNVTILDGWSVDGSYATQDATFNVSAGTNRIVVVGISAEKNQNGPIAVTSVSLGDQVLTEVFNFTVGSSTAYHNLHWFGYLLESEIAARNGSGLTISYGNAPSNPFDEPKIHYASYENVDQTTPIADWDSTSSTSASSIQLTGTITAGTGDKIVGFNVVGQHYAPGLSTSGYTEETESIGATNGHASAAYDRTATTSVTENPTFTSATATRMAVSALVLNGAAAGVDNDPPVLGNNTLTLNEGATVVLAATNLSATDADTDDPTLTFTVSSVTNGQFEFVGTAGVITSFTQAELTTPGVQFVHNGSELAPSYFVSVNDGTQTVGPVAATINFTNVDDEPPEPDPTWATVPHSTGSSSISMTATTASDENGVEYYFMCAAGGCQDSGWQDSAIYEDTGLQPGIQYTYQVKARDKSVNQNETNWSNTASATTENPNTDPVGSGDSASTDEDTAVTIDVLENDSDVNGDTLVIDSVTQPTNGNVLNNGSDVTYTPDAEYCGTDSFTYMVNDGNGGTDTAPVDVTVTCLNDAPVADDLTVTTEEDTAVAIILTGSDLDGDPLTYIVESGPSSGILSGTAPELTYTPDVGFTGIDSFTYTANDGTDDSDEATVTITVNPENQAPIVEAGPGRTVTLPDSASLNGTVTDDGLPAGSTLTTTWSMQSGPGTVTFGNSAAVDTTASFSGAGTYVLKLEATDGDKSDFDEVTITVDPDEQPPSPNPTWATAPYATGTSSISMTATTVSDPSGVEYYFEEVSGNPGASDSGWQDSASFTDTGLNADTTYIYRVQARDKSANQNQTDWSSELSATTDAEAPKSGCGAAPMYGDNGRTNLAASNSVGNALLPLLPSMMALGLWRVKKAGRSRKKR